MVNTPEILKLYALKRRYDWMIDIVSEAKKCLADLSKENRLTTGKVRSVSAALYSNLEDKNIDNVFSMCENLLHEREWALGVIAYDWAYRVKKQYNDNTFSVFEGWLKKYIKGWGDCDDFCTHAFGELLSSNNKLFTSVFEWTRHPDFFVRRAAAVILIYPIRQNKYECIKPFMISDALMNDSHYLVLKGYGWMLKVLSEAEPEKVYEYLIKNRNCMPRVAFRYALEKLDKDKKEYLMKQ